MPTLSVSLTVSYGSLVPNGAVPRREPFTYLLEYSEESCKVVAVPPNSTDFPIALDSVANPKFLMVAVDLADVIVSLDDGVTNAPTTTTLAAGAGWIMMVNPLGQTINGLKVTSPSSPASGARVRVIAFE